MSAPTRICHVCRHDGDTVPCGNPGCVRAFHAPRCDGYRTRGASALFCYACARHPGDTHEGARDGLSSLALAVRDELGKRPEPPDTAPVDTQPAVRPVPAPCAPRPASSYRVDVAVFRGDRPLDVEPKLYAGLDRELPGPGRHDDVERGFWFAGVHSGIHSVVVDDGQLAQIHFFEVVDRDVALTVRFPVGVVVELDLGVPEDVSGNLCLLRGALELADEEAVQTRLLGGHEHLLVKVDDVEELVSVELSPGVWTAIYLDDYADGCTIYRPVVIDGTARRIALRPVG